MVIFKQCSNVNTKKGVFLKISPHIFASFRACLAHTQRLEISIVLPYIDEKFHKKYINKNKQIC